jgi:hypothetical protein
VRTWPWAAEVIWRGMVAEAEGRNESTIRKTTLKVTLRLALQPA